MDEMTLTKRFIGIESITGNETGFAEDVESVLRAEGWFTTRQYASSERYNILATPAKNTDPALVFCSHLDTVAPYLKYREDEEFIYGRGACDAKGVIAAMIAAANRLRKDNMQKIGLLFTVGEEVDSIGAKYANAHAPDNIQYTIVGEPTQNKLVVGQKGLYLAEIHTNGTAAHSAYPELGDSAVLKLLDIIQKLRQHPLPIHPKRGATTLNISQLTGGDRYNVIPDSASAGLLFRVSTKVADVKKLVQDAVGDDGIIQEINECEPQEMLSVPGFEEEIVAFSTDIPYLTNWGEKVLFGPGSILDAHTPDEKISKKSLRKSVDQYCQIAEYLLGV